MRKLIFLFTILCLGSLNAFAQNVTFKATSERAVVVNQQFRINYTLTTGGERGKEPRLAELKDFDVLFGPTLSNQGTSTTIINGNVSTQATAVYTYVLLAKEEGTFTIPAATIKVGNSEYKSNELTIKVLPADQAAAASSGGSGSQGSSGSNQGSSQPATESSSSVGGNDIFVRMHASKSSVYENEGFLVTFKLYSLIDFNGFESVKFPEFEGFIAQEIELPENKQWSLENYNGRNYRTVVLKQTILYPQRSGKITIGAGKFDAVARVRSQQRVRSIFDDFFDSYTNVKKTLSTSPVTIDVKSLPSGKPASFNGAVGDYKMTSSISTTDLKSNDAVTIKVVISGNGNIKLIKNPEIVFPNDFEVYDPTVNTTSKVNSSGVSGSKTIEYYAIPRYAGKFTIPKAEFSYFDLKSGTYKTLYTDEYNLNVAQGEGGGGEAPTIISTANKEDVRFVGKDIRYIKADGFSFHTGSFFYGTIIYWLCYLIPALLFIGYFIINRKKAAENSNIALVRTKKANKVASKRLKTAGKYLTENKEESFYDEMLKAVWGYLSDKLNIPVSSLTKDNVQTELSQYGVGEDLIKEFMDILNTAEFARFAPSKESGAMGELYNSTVQAINKMENTIKK